ncbi:Dematin [Dissostichus eleginoides]|uniref:Dematin n=1 Tax=Dissostichus eleginoides TaxID=100907 RepID=A0AAD9F0A6_DISEL|nr:Dematin [Dissostichus eleginoides]
MHCGAFRLHSTFEQQEQRLSADMQKVEAQVSPAHLAASRGTTPGSPATGITARVDDQLVGYRDLAALPRDKAILQRSLSPPPLPIMSPEVKARRAQSETDSVSPAGSTLTLQEKRRNNGDNIYMKPPIYKQDVIKVSEGLTVIRSAMFPAAQPPDPNLPSKIETEYWPCPPSLATMVSPPGPSVSPPVSPSVSPPGPSVSLWSFSVSSWSFSVSSWSFMSSPGPQSPPVSPPVSPSVSPLLH